MRARFLGAAVAALLAPVAYAGDITPQGKIAAPQASAQDSAQWNRTGVYVGLLGGYDITTLQADGLDLNSGKLMAGAMVGYNWRVNQHFVLGVEGDWMFTGIHASSTSEEFSVKASTDSLLSLRLRAGIPLGHTLLYITGGLAWQNSKITIDNAISDRTWQLGAAFGGGAEVELSRAFALRLEYLHYAFPSNGAPLSEILDSQNQHDIVRLGAVFKLN